MVRPDEVDFRENSRAGEGHGEVLDMWYRIPVWHCAAIQCTVVATRSPVSLCLFRDHVQWRGPIGGGGPDDAQLQHVIEFLPCDLEAFGAQATGSCCGGGSGCADVVSYVVFHRRVRQAWSSDSGKFRKDFVVS